SGLEDDARQLRRVLPEPATVRGRDLEVERERVAVDRVGHEERIEAVALEDAEIRCQARAMRPLEQLAVDGTGGGGGNEALVLDQPAGAVRFLPVGHVVEQERESRVGLPIAM